MIASMYVCMCMCIYIFLIGKERKNKERKWQRWKRQAVICFDILAIWWAIYPRIPRIAPPPIARSSWRARLSRWCPSRLSRMVVYTRAIICFKSITFMFVVWVRSKSLESFDNVRHKFVWLLPEAFVSQRRRQAIIRPISLNVRPWRRTAIFLEPGKPRRRPCWWRRTTDWSIIHRASFWFARNVYWKVIIIWRKSSIICSNRLVVWLCLARARRERGKSN